jgi:hypothetical protein
MTIVMPEQSAHYYDAEGKPRHTVMGKTTGRPRPTTVKDMVANGWYPSVTSILSVIAKPGLESWKSSQAIMAALTLPQLEGEVTDDFAKRVVHDMEAQVKKAAKKGTEIHKTIETYLLGHTTHITPTAMPAIRWLNENIQEVICAEQVLVNKVQGYAGTVDLICVLKDTSKTSIIDFKSQGPKNGKFTVYPEWGLQLEAYKRAYEGGLDSKRLTPERLQWPSLENIDLLSVVVSSEEPQDVLVHVWDQEGSTRRWEAFKAAHTLWKWSKNL